MINKVVIGYLMLLMLDFGQHCLQAQVCIRNDNTGNFYNLLGGDCINAISTAVPFLSIVPDARSGAMGDVGLAISSDANSIHFNASKLVFAEKNASVAISLAPWLRSLGLNSTYLGYLSGYKQLDDKQVLSGSFRYFSSGNNRLTDINGDKVKMED